MSIIAFPPTPQKTPTVNKEGEGISSQILPLSRLSMSGSNCSTSPVLSEADQRNSYSSPPPGKYDFIVTCFAVMHFMTRMVKHTAVSSF